jgi:hypothetical protein
MRITLSQALFGFAIFGTLLTLLRSGGCGNPEQIVSHVVFSPDGVWLAATMYNGRDANVHMKHYTADVYRTIELFSADGAQRYLLDQEFWLGNLGPFHSIRKGPSVAFRPSTAQLYVLPWRREGVDVFNLNQIARQETIKNPTPEAAKYTHSIAISLDGRTLLIGNDVELGLLSLEADAHAKYRAIPMTDVDVADPVVSVSSDGHYAAVAGRWTSSVVICDLFNNSIHHTQPASGTGYLNAIFSPSDNDLAIPRQSGVELYNVDTGMSRTIDSGADSSKNALAWTPDGRTLAVSDFNSVRILDVTTGRLDMQLQQKWASALAFSPDGRSLATGGFDGAITLWNLETGKAIWSSTVRGGYRLPWTVPTLGLFVLLLIARHYSRKCRSQEQSRG